MGDDISIAEPAGKNRQIRVGSKIEVYHKNIDEDNDIAIVKVSIINIYLTTKNNYKH